MKQKKEGFFRMFQQYVENFTKETCVDVEEKKYNAAMTSYQKCMSISLQRKWNFHTSTSSRCGGGRGIKREVSLADAKENYKAVRKIV